MILAKYMDNIESTTRLKELRIIFIYDVLVALGYWPKGKNMIDPDKVLESVLERSLNSKRVGERVLRK